VNGVSAEFINALTSLTYKVSLYRLVKDIESGKLKMGRLQDKLTKASGVVQRQHEKIEKRADAIIEREAVIERRTEEAFSPHESMLKETETGLDALEHALATVTNNPLPDGMPEEPKPQHPPGLTRGSV
jgi:hypothetical protein